MIRYEIRQAILAMQEKGLGLREISRVLKVSRNTVRRVLREPEPKAVTASSEQQDEVIKLLPEIYRRCKGNAVRIREILREERAIELPYSTLTRLLRDRELRAPKRRSGIYHFAYRDVGEGREQGAEALPPARRCNTTPHPIDWNWERKNSPPNAPV